MAPAAPPPLLDAYVPTPGHLLPGPYSSPVALSPNGTSTLAPGFATSGSGTAGYGGFLHANTSMSRGARENRGSGDLFAAHIQGRRIQFPYGKHPPPH
ncbi:hypothetical protein STCU_11131 [Strigomonas culicis]|uniref:Uncharacterized protein n=1 Tax=Strigomonas culicis TaxID=28005 RepID=S9TI91_9TRYP|nr:hypothetical protein STCU_11131 [Strigomonas culicis]|eukprot:EPY16579.1 hypothetical protein STCU_11131 [Strigomonas culicis]